jgi:hypothetical protein
MERGGLPALLACLRRENGTSGSITMKPGEAIRYACDECQAVFDLTLAPISEWVELQDEDTAPEDVEVHCWPFCGAGTHELRELHDRPTTTA